MSSWSINKVRDTFLQFFADKKHTLVDSSPILPAEDATLLFTNAGMNQFKNIFMGQESRSYSRACSAQKCVRAGGKHNDLENVGFTARHHTFFEMLGNFSFGDYFKEEAIAYAWELLTEVYKLPKERLYVTVFETDDEALAIWRDKIGVPEERIFKLGEKDNFWAMGDTGPCGPCSEVHYDLGENFVCDAPFVDGQPDWDCGRFVEIWNLVFMQYNRTSDGIMTPLPKPSIDTGMGLERVVAILNGKMSNYDIDVFVDLKKTIVKFLPESSNIIDTSLNVIADHARATAFLIADTITPSNEGRGYVLRRIMRRAIRHGHKIGFKEPFFYRICDSVISLMKGAYPSLETQRELILNIALEEEKRFGQTLEKGLELLDTGVEDAIASDKKILPGDLVFKLYDTFGFPPDLTDTILQERDLSYDKDEYTVAMENQRNRGKASWSKSLDDNKQQAAMALTEDGIVKPEFEGYDKSELEGSIVAMFNTNFDRIDSLSKGDTAFVVLSPMLFYAESGGQVGDRGFLERNNKRVANVVDCIKLGDYQAAKIVADVDMVTGFLVKQKLCEEIRNNIRCNHSATHLLHLCLHEVVGPHANQSGSLVTPEKMRFDFTHYAALTDEQILKLEQCVNKHIQENYHVCTAIKKIDEAKEDGAMSLFGEKYGEVVRVVTMGGSKELCGGTHIKFTGQIGFFKIVKEEGIAAGVRRIEAVTGMGALRFVQKREQVLADISAESGVEPDLVVAAITKIKESDKKNKRELTLLRQKLAAAQAGSFTPVATVNDIPLFVIDADGDRPTAMSVLDSLKSHNKDGLFLVIGNDKDRGLAIVALNGAAKKQFNAGNILKDILKVFGGKGGGRPDMAQGSAPKTIELDKAIEALKTLI